MNNNIVRASLKISGAILFLLFLGSCASYKKITYLKDIPNNVPNIPSQTVATDVDSFSSIRIQPYDLLQVSIHTLDPQVNAILNQSSEGISATYNNSGVLVDQDGVIVLPVIGKVKVVGLTTAEARDSINRRANIFLKDPIVNVRLANFKITVLGEVTRPAQYTVPDEKVNVIDALGLAGDLTVYGRRDNVLLIRRENEGKKYIRMDLTSSQFINSPYYYLKQGDALYVEPIKLRSVLPNPKVRDLTIISSAVLVLSLIVGIVNISK